MLWLLYLVQYAGLGTIISHVQIPPISLVCAFLGCTIHDNAQMTTHWVKCTRKGHIFNENMWPFLAAPFHRVTMLVNVNFFPAKIV